MRINQQHQWPPRSHHNDDDDHAPAEDEDTGAQVAPIVKLEEVAVSTGEEEEDPILDLYVNTRTLTLTVLELFVVF